MDVLLEAEVEKRERNVVKRRLKEAHFSKVKTLEESDFEAASHISSARLASWLKATTRVGRNQ